MRYRSRTIIPALAAALALAAAPAFAGIHYKSTTHTDGSSKVGDAQVEGWVSGAKARVDFRESGNPVAKKGSYLITKDGGKTVYLVNPEEKSYALWDLKAMIGDGRRRDERHGAAAQVRVHQPQGREAARRGRRHGGRPPHPPRALPHQLHHDRQGDGHGQRHRRGHRPGHLGDPQAHRRRARHLAAQRAAADRQRASSTS